MDGMHCIMNRAKIHRADKKAGLSQMVKLHALNKKAGVPLRRENYEKS